MAGGEDWKREYTEGLAQYLAYNSKIKKEKHISFIILVPEGIFYIYTGKLSEKRSLDFIGWLVF